jgi:4-amino-4-deoxy-L-arabinose transferase-like glycosyltransferase
MMRKNLLFFVILFLISSFIIFFRFNLIPKNLSFDEVDFAKLTLSLDEKPYVPYSNLATGHSTLYFYIILSSFKTFGFNNFALRLPSAIFGVISILVFYLLIKELVSKSKYVDLFAFLTSFILVTSRWFFNFARFSFEATFLLFLELTSLFFIIKYLKNQKTIFLILSGVFSGLSFLSYTPGRIFFLLPLMILLIKKINWKKCLYFLLPFLIVSLPLIYYLVVNNDPRIKQTSVFSQRISPPSKLALINENVKRTASMFIFGGDMNGRHNYPGKPALNPILGLFFIIGFILSIKNFKEFNNKLMISYFIIAILPTLFTKTAENPNMLRTFTVLPSVSYFATTAITRLSNIKFKLNKVYVLSIIFLLVLISSLYEIRTYFLFQSRVVKNSFEVKCNLEQIQKLKTNIIPKNCRVQKNEF